MHLIFHANTHIPIVVGSQRRCEVTSDPLSKVKSEVVLLSDISLVSIAVH